MCQDVFTTVYCLSIDSGYSHQRRRCINQENHDILLAVLTVIYGRLKKRGSFRYKFMFLLRLFNLSSRLGEMCIVIMFAHSRR